jgi:hypothetical protein
MSSHVRVHTNALERTAIHVSAQYELLFPCAQVPEPHAPVSRTRQVPLVVVRHGNGGHNTLHHAHEYDHSQRVKVYERQRRAKESKGRCKAEWPATHLMPPKLDRTHTHVLAALLFNVTTNSPACCTRTLGRTEDCDRSVGEARKDLGRRNWEQVVLSCGK